MRSRSSWIASRAADTLGAVQTNPRPLNKTRVLSRLAPAFALLLASSLVVGCSGGGGGGGDGAAGAGSGGDGGAVGTTADAGGARSIDAPRRNTCPGPVIASWKVDGTPYVASTVGYGSVGPTWQLTIVECVDDGVDKTLQFSMLPTPVAVGTYPLSFKILHAMPANGNAGAMWAAGKNASISADTNYYTDSTRTGTFEVTAVDAAAMKFSARFSFSAVNDAGTGMVSVTEGTIENATYR